MSYKRGFIFGLVLGVVVTFGGMWGMARHQNQTSWQDGEISPGDKIEAIYSLLNTHSVMDFDRDTLLEGMFRGFVDGVGDPYTQYLTREALEAFNVRTEGTFVGIGVRIFMDHSEGLLNLLRVFPNSPAMGAGLMQGDRIISVDGTQVQGFTQAEILNLIAGEEGTPVTIGIYRPSEDSRFEATMYRARIIVPTIEYELMESDGRRTGYIRIEAFEQPTYSQFRTALNSLTDQAIDSLVIDVRNNPGGLLNIVSEITGLLIPEGVVTYTEDAHGERIYYNTGPNYLGLPLVVLINGRSASASEVLAGAVQDVGVATLVGQQTYGKGSVQRIIPLRDGTGVKITTAKYFTPHGRSIHGVGLAPDFLVEMDEETAARIGMLPPEEDVQLQIGLRVVRGK